MRKTLSILSGVLALVSYGPYDYAIIYKPHIQPIKATWIVWALVNMVVLVGMYSKKAQNPQIVFTTLGSIITLILVLWFGRAGWDTLHILCLGLGIFGIVLWKAFDDARFGILMSLIVDFIGSVPTFQSIWVDPAREDGLAWMIAWFGSICACLAIPRRTLTDAAQPISFLVNHFITMYLLFIKPNM